MHELLINTEGERFYDITKQVQSTIKSLQCSQGIALLYCPHTSCALCLNEAFDPSAQHDMEEFLKRMVPLNSSWITHTAEGADDSPSHLKSMLLRSDLGLIIENGELKLGQWQGVYLAEFRHSPKERKLWLKIING